MHAVCNFFCCNGCMPVLLCVGTIAITVFKIQTKIFNRLVF